mmetsp:Transcript_16378/g.27690  ORF Transcript_16378/g.27690 Transcript_16378/m.27690 type:complete len:224 (+) Transcript_16378:74-745(+)
MLFKFLLLALGAAMVLSFVPPRTTSMWMARRQTLSMEFDWKETKKLTEERMSKSLESIQGQFNTLRTGGANPNILDRVLVEYYGSLTPLNQVARVAAANSETLVVEPFDKSIMKDVEKAIAMAELNLNPNTDGDMIRINIPPLTEDRRKDLVKQAKSVCEDGKVSIRNIRRDSVDSIKKAEKDKDIGKDDSKGFQDDIQKTTDSFVKKLETMLKTKETDLMKI